MGLPQQHRHALLSSPHSRRNRRPCDDDDDDNNDDNNARMRHAHIEIAATTSREPIEVRGGGESKEIAKEAAKVTQIWKETNCGSNALKPYNDIPPKKQKTQTSNQYDKKEHV